MSKSKLAAKYNQVLNSDSAYEILNAKLEEAAAKSEVVGKQSTSGDVGRAEKEESFFDNPIVRSAGRTAANIITRSLLGALGLGGRSRKKSFW